jgi:electron transport complex protein RnfC
VRKIWDFHGGVHPSENKTQSNHCAIGDIPLPKELTVPLNQHIGAEAQTVVNVGDKVLKGQIIAEAQGYISANVHAPSSGTVTAIGQRSIPHPSGMQATCVVIETDGLDEWIKLEPISNWKTLKKGALIDAVRAAGISGMGGAGFPTSVKINPRHGQHIDTLIVNGTECEPYITADDMLMREHADEIVAGVEILSHVLGQPEHIIIGIEDNKPEAIQCVQAAVEKADTNIEVVVFPTKYPSGGEKQLIQILTGKEVPSGQLPSDIGIVLQNVGTAQAVYKAITFGEPLIERVTTVVGESLEQQRNVRLRIGTPIEHVLTHHGFNPQNCARLIIGGPMMGFAIEELKTPVIKSTNCLLVPSKAEMPDPDPQQACIRCGMCAEACPASLLPQQLYWYSRSEDFEKLESHNLADCIECGACSFVCPSNIPLVQYYRASKGAIRIHEKEKQKSDHARQRFEFRKIRIEQQEAEKEAKRAARKKAAEAAQKVAADKKAESKTEKVDSTPAVEDTAKAKAKLERALSSAKSRLERAQNSLATAQQESADQSRIDTLSARVKEAELKVSQAEKKLGEFSASESQTKNTDEAIKDKLNANANVKLGKSIETLEKRLATAEERLKEAEAAGSDTVDALKNGVEKLRQKLASAKSELTAAPEPAGDQAAPAELNAADAAIEKAKKRAEDLKNMSADEKQQAQIASLKKRIEKAQKRLEDAEQNNDEHIDVYRESVRKLEMKLQDIEPQ